MLPQAVHPSFLSPWKRITLQSSDELIVLKVMGLWDLPFSPMQQLTTTGAAVGVTPRGLSIESVLVMPTLRCYVERDS
jgi:hypothetical protein